VILVALSFRCFAIWVLAVSLLFSFEKACDFYDNSVNFNTRMYMLSCAVKVQAVTFAYDFSPLPEMSSLCSFSLMFVGTKASF
jgi:hypothetical protein